MISEHYAWDSATLRKVNELEYFSGTWQKCDSTKAKDFSAVAYYFGKKLQEKLHVPVGLIEVAVGGSTTESWLDRYTMEHHPVLVNELNQWRRSDFFQPWVRERADSNLEKAINPRQRHPYEPCYNFEAGIKPFVDLPIAGVIWYQGESNAHNIELHETVFAELVKSWRKQWGCSLPFYYVQLSSLNRPSWTSFRYSQLQLLKQIPNSGKAENFTEAKLIIETSTVKEDAGYYQTASGKKSESEKQKPTTGKIAALDKIRKQYQGNGSNGNGHVNQPLQIETLQKAWNDYVQKLKQAKNPAAQSFELATLKIKDDNCFEVTTANNIEQKFIEQDRNKLFVFLQEHLHNRLLQFSVIIEEPTATTKLKFEPSLTATQQFQKMIEMYPIVKELKDRLRLELDY